MTDALSYEQARDELVAVVQRLESGGTSLQESIELWERGEELAAICQRWLDGARTRFDAVASSKDSAAADVALGSDASIDDDNGSDDA